MLSWTRRRRQVGDFESRLSSTRGARTDRRRYLLDTHTGARNIGVGAMTAHSFAQKRVLHGTFSGSVVLIDEISFMSIDLLAALEQLRLKGVRLFAFGDFRQLPPVCNRWRGQKVPSDLFGRSRLFRQWSAGNRFVLRRRRRSDQAHSTIT